MLDSDTEAKLIQRLPLEDQGKALIENLTPEEREEMFQHRKGLVKTLREKHAELIKEDELDLPKDESDT